MGSNALIEILSVDKLAAKVMQLTARPRETRAKTILGRIVFGTGNGCLQIKITLRRLRKKCAHLL